MKKSRTNNGKTFIFFLTIFSLIILICTSKQVIAKAFTKLPTFNWILVTSNGGVNGYIDTNNIKTIDNKYKIYWSKYEQGIKGKLITRQAIDCDRKITTILGGVQYNVNNYVVLDVEEYNEYNFKSATEWEYVSPNDMLAQKICQQK